MLLSKVLNFLFGMNWRIKMVREVKHLTNIRLTESDTDGIWLHFDGGNLQAGISLGSLFTHGVITSEAIEAWAREQLDKQDIAHRRFYRPSPPVEGGY